MSAQQIAPSYFTNFWKYKRR